MTLNHMAARLGGCSGAGRATVPAGAATGAAAAATSVCRRPRHAAFTLTSPAPWPAQQCPCMHIWQPHRHRGNAVAAAAAGPGSVSGGAAPADNGAGVDRLLAGVAAEKAPLRSAVPGRGRRPVKEDAGDGGSGAKEASGSSEPAAGRVRRQAEPEGSSPEAQFEVQSQQQQQQQQQQLASDAILAPRQKSRAPAAAARSPLGSKTLSPPRPQQQPGHAAAPRGAPSRAPDVMKGDLALPGGPRWSGLRRHVHAAGSNPELPTISAIVVVEGDEDQRAVAKAVNAPVYVCDGTRVLRPHAAEEVKALATLGRNVLVLTDPDERGRQLRGHLDGLLAPLMPAATPPRRVLHAFVPELSAMSDVDGPVHAAGNRGIEHAVPGVLITALRSAAPSYPVGRAVWDLPRLESLGLARPFDGGKAAQQAHREAPSAVAAALGEPRERRRRLCAALGLGRCSGSQLVGALNRYFDEKRVEAALAMVDQQLAALGADPHREAVAGERK